MRRPFLLLEVVIAGVLVGAFAFLSIHGAFRTLNKQHKQLRELEAAIQADEERMAVIQAWWQDVYLAGKEHVPPPHYKVEYVCVPDAKCSLLTVTHKQPPAGKYHYVIEHR